jgi:hypothetical protein
VALKAQEQPLVAQTVLYKKTVVLASVIWVYWGVERKFD